MVLTQTITFYSHNDINCYPHGTRMSQPPATDGSLEREAVRTALTTTLALFTQKLFAHWYKGKQNGGLAKIIKQVLLFFLICKTLTFHFIRVINLFVISYWKHLFIIWIKIINIKYWLNNFWQFKVNSRFLSIIKFTLLVYI